MQHVRFKRLARLHTSEYVSIRPRLHLKHRMQHVRFKRQRLVRLPRLKNRLLEDRAPQLRLQPPVVAEESAEQEEQEAGKEEKGGRAGGQGQWREQKERGGVQWEQQQRHEEQ